MTPLALTSTPPQVPSRVILIVTMVLRFLCLALAVCLMAPGQSTPSLTGSSEVGGTVLGNPPNDQPETPPLAVCPAGGPIGAVSLMVRSPRRGDAPLPFKSINHLTEGDTVLYSPVLRQKEKRPGEVSLVMVPEKKSSSGDSLIVTDPKAADKPQEWAVDQTMSLAVFVYGPEGLSRKKVRRFLSQDDVLIAQLADYAEKTAETEALLQALSTTDSTSDSMNAALTGFASQYGVAVAIDRTAPPAVQAQTLFATMNPQLATYDPITPSAGSRVAQTASLTTAAASLFFGTPIGLAAGGTAMLLELRSIAFPGTQFRSSFAQPLKGGINLCGQRTPAPPHTRVAYVWASRIPNTPRPALKVLKASYIPAGQKSPVPVEVPSLTWKYLDRAREWTIENSDGKKFPVKVLRLGNQKALELDLTKASIAPGDYRLAGYSDWTPFQAEGPVHVRTLSDFKLAQLQPASQDRLLAKNGKTAVTLQNEDFEFTNKVELKKLHDEFATAEPVPFLLPQGLREGPQDHLDVQVNTADLDPGEYQLLLYQQDGKSHPVPINVLANPPKIDNLPIIANQGVAEQHYVLKGERLGLLTRLESPAATLQLDPATPDQSQRSLTVHLKSDLHPDTSYALTAHLQDRSESLSFDGALQITGPLPLIASSKLSVPAGVAVSINPGEVPAGDTLSAMLDVKNIQAKSVLQLNCQQQEVSATALHIGEQTEKSSLQQLSPDQLFLSFDTSSLPAGCSLQAVIDNGEGHSQPYTLARIVRFPQVDQLVSSSDESPDGKRGFVLTGRNLEMLQQVGWDQLKSFQIDELPTPLPGIGQHQSLRIAMVDPPTPASTLYVWLRGEKSGRSTSITCTRATSSSPTSAIGPTQSVGKAAEHAPN